MNTWRDTILKHFAPNVSDLTLVADPDKLLTEEKLALALRERGFEMVEFDDPIEFRYIYELRYRSVWDKGGQSDVVVAVHLRDTELGYLPYDLLKASRRLSFDLGKLFPNLSYTIIEKLDRSKLDALFDAPRESSPRRKGDNDTKDFILRHVFGIAAELIVNEVDLLRILLDIHYGKLQLPPVLGKRLICILEGKNTFNVWPLTKIVSDDREFFAFLQERWPIFLASPTNINQVREGPPVDHLKYLGPIHLPFDHERIRVYIDNLFLEGKLTPVKFDHIEADVGSWARSGIIDADDEDNELQISGLFRLIENKLPTPEFRHSDWLNFAMRWAELASKVYCGNNVQHRVRLKKIGSEINVNFVDWLAEQYASLIYLSSTKPTMLHHVLRRLARDMEDSGYGRVALIVVDGLALDQWVTIREFLNEQDTTLHMRESATFAWIPTLTSVSRQAIFSGKLPCNFPLSIYRTDREEVFWKQFWEERYDISQWDIVYQRGLGGGDAAALLDDLIHPDKTRVVGLVIDEIDKAMHGKTSGAAGMHNEVMLWCKGRFLLELVTYLLDYEYEVWLTSDHGNVECIGKGYPSDGSIADYRGERTRVYPTPELRSRVADSFSFAYEWEPIGLPEGHFPLVASGYDAFAKAGETIVGHGGISIEEVIVPLVKFERRARQ